MTDFSWVRRTVGLGETQTQFFIPKAWELQSRGGRVVAKKHFKRDGHVQPR